MVATMLERLSCWRRAPLPCGARHAGAWLSLPLFSKLSRRCSASVCGVLLMLAVLGPASAGPLVYVGQSGGTVTVLDEATRSVVTTISGVGAGGHIAISPSRNRAYVADSLGNSVTVIDTSNHAVVGSISVGTRPSGVAVNASGSHVFVTNVLSGTVSVIDADTNTVVNTIGVGLNPFGIAYNQATNRLFVVNKGSNSVSVVNATTHAVVATITAGNLPEEVAVNSSGSRVYVASAHAATITVIDATNSAVISEIAVGALPNELVIGKDGSRLYTSLGTLDKIAVIDTSSNTLVTQISVGDWPGGLSITPDGRFLYVSNSFSDDVSVVDTSTNVELGYIPGIDDPASLSQFLETSPQLRVTASYGGLFWNSARSGEGLQVGFAVIGETRYMVITWYTYDPQGNPIFLLGAGSIDAALLGPHTFSMGSARGARFGAAFNPADVVRSSWGSATVNFTSCDSLTLAYTSPLEGYGSGQIVMTRTAPRPPEQTCL